MPDFLSHSQLQTLKDCGEKYRLKYIERAQPQPSAAAIGGTAIHAATDAIDRMILIGHNDYEELARAGAWEANNSIGDSLQEVQEKSPDYVDPATWHTYGRWTRQWPHGQDLAWFQKVAIPAGINNYIRWRSTTVDLVPWDAPDFGPAIELPFETTIFDRPVHGKIDRIFQSTSNGALVLLDIKNGPKPKNSAQLGTYANAMRTAYPDLTFRWGTFLTGLKYDPNNPKLKTKAAKLTLPIDLDYWTEDRLARANVHAIFAIENGIFIPNPGEQCQHCTFTKSCDFYQAALV